MRRDGRYGVGNVILMTGSQITQDLAENRVNSNKSKILH